ncbi:hypothetical protein [Streptomyces sp. NPDC059455]|uniref:hypothetical protein n=1 Tax=Streptomyces sp. NPDC059455 TaxID=3346837 RepID=UPI0036805A27
MRSAQQLHPRQALPALLLASRMRGDIRPNKADVLTTQQWTIRHSMYLVHARKSQRRRVRTGHRSACLTSAMTTDAGQQ